jgi:hypothetical protein
LIADLNSASSEIAKRLLVIHPGKEAGHVKIQECGLISTPSGVMFHSVKHRKEIIMVNCFELLVRRRIDQFLLADYDTCGYTAKHHCIVRYQQRIDNRYFWFESFEKEFRAAISGDGQQRIKEKNGMVRHHVISPNGILFVLCEEMLEWSVQQGQRSRKIIRTCYKKRKRMLTTYRTTNENAQNKC